MRYYLLLALFSISFLGKVSAQTIGLVLSGGGAKGLAHIGVIKALEENGIPIDYIGGTSMGAIIGGLYAAGYSPKEMEEIVLSDEFKYWANGTIQDKYYYYFKQKPPSASWISARFNFDSVWRADIPTNIVSPIQMDLAFIEIFAPASSACNSNFDSLMVPFRCIASDVENGKAVVSRKGNLAQHIRASMTFPFYFKPIEIDGKVLFDGGIYNNFPSDIIYHDFKPDIIIGSQVASNETTLNINDVRSQLESMIVGKTCFEVITPKGLIIKPNVGSVSLMEFDKARMLIDSGYFETLKSIDSIKNIISRRIDTSSLNLKRANFNKKKPELLIKNIIVNGLTANQSTYVYKQLTRKNEVSSWEDLKKEYLKIIADDKIASIYPFVEFNKATFNYDLFLNVKRQPKFNAQFGGNMSMNSNSEAFVSIGYRAFNDRSLSVNGNIYFGKFYSSVQLNGRVDFPTARPFCLEAMTTYNHWDYFKNSGAFFQNISPSYLKQDEQITNISAATPVNSYGKASLGLATGYIGNFYYQIKDFDVKDDADETFFTFTTSYLNIERSTMNRKQYANKGTFLKIQLRHCMGNEKYKPGTTSMLNPTEKHFKSWLILKSTYDNYFKRIGNCKIGFFGEIVISNQQFMSNYQSTILMAPAFEPTIESKTLFLEKYRAINYASIGGKMVWSIIKHLDFRAEAFLFQPYQQILKDDNGKAYYGKPFDFRGIIGAVAVVYNTPLGPLSLSFNGYSQNYKAYSFMLNFGYILFNKRAFE